MSDQNVLTKQLAEQWLKDNESVDLQQFTEIEDAAAESLAEGKRSIIKLDGLTSLSDAAAKNLSKNKASLSLDGLSSISDAVAESLSKCEGLTPDYSRENV